MENAKLTGHTHKQEYEFGDNEDTNEKEHERTYSVHSSFLIAPNRRISVVHVRPWSIIALAMSGLASLRRSSTQLYRLSTICHGTLCHCTSTTSRGRCIERAAGRHAKNQPPEL